MYKLSYSYFKYASVIHVYYLTSPGTQVCSFWFRWHATCCGFRFLFVLSIQLAWIWIDVWQTFHGQRNYDVEECIITVNFITSHCNTNWFIEIHANTTIQTQDHNFILRKYWRWCSLWFVNVLLYINKTKNVTMLTDKHLVYIIQLTG